MIFNSCADVDACDSMRGWGGVGWGGVGWGGVGCLYKHSQPQRVCPETLLWEKNPLLHQGMNRTCVSTAPGFSVQHCMN